MMTKTMLTFALIAGFTAGPAFAFQCPTDMAAIDAALETAELSEADKARVAELRQQGQGLHEAGDHQASVDTLAEAKQILGIE